MTTATKPVTFVSRRRDHQVILVPDVWDNHPDGTRDLRRGIWARFSKGTFIANEEAVERIRGESEHDISLGELVDRLRNHTDFGDGFYELEAGALAPEPTEELGKVAYAAARRDTSTLSQLREAEEALHNRPAVIEAIDDALVAIEETEPAPATTGAD